MVLGRKKRFVYICVYLNHVLNILIRLTLQHWSKVGSYFTKNSKQTQRNTCVSKVGTYFISNRKKKLSINAEEEHVSEPHLLFKNKRKQWRMFPSSLWWMYQCEIARSSLLVTCGHYSFVSHVKAICLLTLKLEGSTVKLKCVPQYEHTCRPENVLHDEPGPKLRTFYITLPYITNSLCGYLLNCAQQGLFPACCCDQSLYYYSIGIFLK